MIFINDFRTFYSQSILSHSVIHMPHAQMSAAAPDNWREPPPPPPPRRLQLHDGHEAREPHQRASNRATGFFVCVCVSWWALLSRRRENCGLFPFHDVHVQQRAKRMKEHHTKHTKHTHKSAVEIALIEQTSESQRPT